MVILAGLTSFFVEDLDLLPNQNRLSPLLGGMVVRYSWCDTLISQCWKRKRKRISCHVRPDDSIFDHLYSVQEYDSATYTPTTYSDETIFTLVQSPNILEMNSLLEMFNTHQSPMKRGSQAEVARLNSIRRQYSQSDPVLSSI